MNTSLKFTLAFLLLMLSYSTGGGVLNFIENLTKVNSTESLISTHTFQEHTGFSHLLRSDFLSLEKDLVALDQGKSLYNIHYSLFSGKYCVSALKRMVV